MISNVPCNGCNLCCRGGDLVRILPEDNENEYDTVKHLLFPDEKMLAHKENGDCIYLRSYGCSIHDRKPQMCKEMDCRILNKSMTSFKAKTMGVSTVWNKGSELLKLIED